MADTEATIGRMISMALCLEELIVYCPSSPSSLGSWLSAKSQSLRHLELWMDSILEKAASSNTFLKLDCIDFVRGLETLKLWDVLMTQPPKWAAFQRLQKLEIVGARMRGNVLTSAIRACHNLTGLVLLGCDGVKSASIALQKLEQCRLDFYGRGDCLLSISSPKLQLLDIHGCCWIHVDKNHSLRSLSISKLLLDSRFAIPCLEKVVITVRTPLNAEQKISTLESLVKYCGRLKKMIRVSQMKNSHNSADEFFEEICKFANMNSKLVRIE